MPAAPIQSDPDILGGTPCFAGTPVPVRALFDYLKGGDSLETFLADFPGVTRDQAVAVLEMSSEWLQKMTPAA